MECDVTVKLLKKYVDNLLTTVRNLPVGSRYNGNKITASSESIKEDMEAGLTQEEITMIVLKEIANIVTPFSEFTAEVSMGSQKPVPCLDSQLWYDETQEQTPWFKLVWLVT